MTTCGYPSALPLPHCSESPDRPVSDRPLRILQVGTVDTRGGAASVADRLMQAYKIRGHESSMAVGRRVSDDPNVFALPDDRRAVYRMTGYASLQQRLNRMAGRSPGTGWGWLSRSLRLATHPRTLVEQVSGWEDFEFPGTYDLLDLTPARPDVVHCHNLHGGYFDLRALKWLNRQVPTVLTLHDAWLLSGHCRCDRPRRPASAFDTTRRFARPRGVIPVPHGASETPAQQHRAHREPGADRAQEHEIALLQASLAPRVGERQRDRPGRG